MAEFYAIECIDMPVLNLENMPVAFSACRAVHNGCFIHCTMD